MLHLLLVVDEILELEVTRLALLGFRCVHATLAVSLGNFLMNFSFMLFCKLQTYCVIVFSCRLR